MSPPFHAPTAASPLRSGHPVPEPLRIAALLLQQRQRVGARAYDSSSPPVARAFDACCVPQLHARCRRRAQSSQPSVSAVGAIDHFMSRWPPPPCSRIGVPAPGLYVVVSARQSAARCASRSTVSATRRSRRTCSCLRRSYRPPPRPSVAALLPWFRCSSSMSECLLSSSSARTRVPSRWCRPRRLRVRLLPCAPPRRRRVVVLVVSFPWWCGGASALPGSSSFSSSNVVVLVLNVSKNQISLARETALLSVH